MKQRWTQGEIMRFKILRPWFFGGVLGGMDGT